MDAPWNIAFSWFNLCNLFWKSCNNVKIFRYYKYFCLVFNDVVTPSKRIQRDKQVRFEIISYLIGSVFPASEFLFEDHTVAVRSNKRWSSPVRARHSLLAPGWRTDVKNYPKFMGLEGGPAGRWIMAGAWVAVKRSVNYRCYRSCAYFRDSLGRLPIHLNAPFTNGPRLLRQPSHSFENIRVQIC